MKKILLTAVLMISAIAFASAQTFNDVTFLGVDFSAVNVLHTDETEEQFISAFEKINVLMVSETEKYDVAKYLAIDIKETDLRFATQNIETLRDRDFTDSEEEKISIETVLSSYPKIQGVALLLVAQTLDKAQAVGQYDIVVFDGTTKEIFKIESLAGAAGGFGLRNYWAGSIYNGLKKYMKDSKRKK